jgi:hypothetical protein
VLFDDNSWECFDTDQLIIQMDSIRVLPGKDYFRWTCDLKLKENDAEHSPRRTIMNIIQKDAKNRKLRSDTFNITSYLSAKKHRYIHIDAKIKKNADQIFPQIITEISGSEICIRRSYYIFSKK